jgi:hypothetical protein
MFGTLSNLGKNVDIKWNPVTIRENIKNSAKDTVDSIETLSLAMA